MTTELFSTKQNLLQYLECSKESSFAGKSRLRKESIQKDEKLLWIKQLEQELKFESKLLPSTATNYMTDFFLIRENRKTFLLHLPKY